MTFVLWASVALIGGAGSVVRFLVDQHVARRSSAPLPMGTLSVNVSGSFALGLITGLAIGPDAVLLAGTAAVGSFTTFSTWVFETQRLAEERQLRIAGSNLVVSIVLAAAAASLGQTLGARL